MQEPIELLESYLKDIETIGSTSKGADKKKIKQHALKFRASIRWLYLMKNKAIIRNLKQ